MLYFLRISLDSLHRTGNEDNCHPVYALDSQSIEIYLLFSLFMSLYCDISETTPLHYEKIIPEDCSTYIAERLPGKRTSVSAM